MSRRLKQDTNPTTHAGQVIFHRQPVTQITIKITCTASE